MKKHHMVLPFVSGIISNNKGEILIGKQSNKTGKPYPGRWDLPGGKLEKSESAQECLKREIKEETGYDTKKTTLFDTFHHDQKEFLKDYKGEISALGICFTVEVDGKFKPNEMEEMHFASKNEIDELVFTPWAKYFLERYFDVKA